MGWRLILKMGLNCWRCLRVVFCFKTIILGVWLFDVQQRMEKKDKKEVYWLMLEEEVLCTGLSAILCSFILARRKRFVLTVSKHQLLWRNMCSFTHLCSSVDLYRHKPIKDTCDNVRWWDYTNVFLPSYCKEGYDLIVGDDFSSRTFYLSFSVYCYWLPQYNASCSWIFHDWM